MIFEKILGIAACDPQGVIGKEGELPWHCPEEVKHFSETTSGSPMIIGYRTFTSLPVHYFKDRTTIVFTHQKDISNGNLNIIFVSSLDDFFAIQKVFKALYVVGGGEIYRLFLEENLISEFILTKMKNQYEGDTFFPLSLLNNWPALEIAETTTFTIHRYFNPHFNHLGAAHAHKNV